MSVKSLFEIASFDFYCSEIDERPDLTMYTLNQIYEDIPVEGGFFQLGIDKNGNPSFVRGNYVNEINTKVIPQFTYEKGKDYLDLKPTEHIQEIQLIIYGLGDIDSCLCWKYVILSNNPLDNRIAYINAVSGAIINTIPIMEATSGIPN